MKTTPFPYQHECLDALEDFRGRAAITMSMGLGKAQPLDAKIATPFGWRLMADIKVGDMVAHPSGYFVEVLDVFPQGEKEVFKVSFADGSSTECCDDHLWSVITASGRKNGYAPKILPLKEIRRKLVDGAGNRRHFIPVTRPVRFPQRDLLLHPYLIGYLLANGCLTDLHSVEVSIPDLETVDRLKGEMPHDTILKCKNGIDHRIIGRHDENVVMIALRRLGMMGKYSYEKRIPKQYMFADIKDRKALLQGLMDGDGWVTSNSDNLGYSSSSDGLAKDVCELVQSLGGIARTHCKKSPKYTHNGEKRIGRPSYVMSILLPNDVKPFLLSRKAQVYKPRTKYLPNRSIKEVVSVGKKSCQCINVDAADGLYLTDDYIVTHNSPVSLWYFAKHKELWPGIIICPAFLKHKWAREAAKHIGISATILNGLTPRKTSFLKTSPLLIINYDILGQRRNKDGSIYSGWLEFLKEKIKPGMLIIDESQNLTSTARWTKCIKDLSMIDSVKSVLALSGTPFWNYPAGMWPMLNIVRPDLYPLFFPYAVRYCEPKKVYGAWTYKGATNLKELRTNLLSTMMFRRRKQDVLPDLPPKIRTVIPLDIDDAEYALAIRRFSKWIGEGRQKQAHVLSQLSELKQIAARAKLPALFDWIDGFLKDDPTGKMLVFGWHREIIESLHDRYKSQSVMIYGNITQRQRDTAEASFQGNKKIRLLFGNMKACGTGLDLTAAHTVAFAEMAWNPGTHIQAEDRAYGRLNDLHGVNVFYLVSSGTVEEFLCELNQRKMGMAEQVLDGKRGVEGFDIHDQIMDYVTKSRESQRFFGKGKD